MTDYKEWFGHMRNYDPTLRSFDSVKTDFWETLYQNFKARLMDETKPPVDQINESQ